MTATSTLGASGRGGHSAGSEGRAVQNAAAPRSATISSRTMPSPAAARRILYDALQPIERLQDLRAAHQRFLALLLVGLDDLFIGVLEEFGIVELGIDPFDIGVDLGELLLQPRLLRREVDDPFERERGDLAAHDQLRRSLRIF